MPDLVTRQDLASFITDLEAACKWIYSYGLQPHQTRFSTYGDILSQVLHHRITNTLTSLTAQVSVQQYQDAYIQSAELIDIWQTFHAHRGNKFAAKLRESVQGPNNPRQERAGRNSRDTLFELSMAAVFRSHGIPVLVGRQIDLISRFQGYPLLCECKRPRAQSGLERSARGASRQLQIASQRYPRAIKPRQIIAMDISLLRNPNYLFLQGPSAFSIGQNIDSQMKSFFHSRASAIGRKLNNDIICVLASLRALAHDTSENRHLNCHKIGVLIYQRQGTSGYYLAEALQEALAPSFDQRTAR